MADVVIFGGTTEGRELAQWLAGQKVPVLVSVATEYGSQVLEDRDGLAVRVGRLDRDGICALLKQEQPRIVVDATHPHAAEVTRLVREACEMQKLSCIRIVRDAASGQMTEYGTSVIQVDTPQQAAKLLKTDDRPVLLTTGSKELELFAAEPELSGRIYARVLPDSRVLAGCEALGIRGRHLIAMQGPFSEEMNVALLRSVHAGWMVTKESGSRGGFEEKLAAARRCGVTTVVIRRPQAEEGLSLEAAIRWLQEKLQDPNPAVSGRSERSLSLIGMGMGLGAQLTLEAVQALKDSDAVLGAPRMLADISRWTEGRITAPVYLGKEILSWVQEHPQCRKICVIYSGDIGFHSGALSLLRLLAEESGLQVRLYPGISTVSCLCARFRLSWEDLCLSSMHGQDCDVIQLLQDNRRVFLLLGGSVGVDGLCRRLSDAGYGKVRVYAGSRLGYPDECLRTGTAESMQHEELDGLSAVILEREETDHER